MRHSPSLRPKATIVSRPRAADAVGVALRNAFVRDCNVPDDMMVLLARLNGNGRARCVG